MSVEIMFFIMKKKNQNDKTLSLEAESPPEGVGRPKGRTLPYFDGDHSVSRGLKKWRWWTRLTIHEKVCTGGWRQKEEEPKGNRMVQPIPRTVHRSFKEKQTKPELLNTLTSCARGLCLTYSLKWTEKTFLIKRIVSFKVILCPSPGYTNCLGDIKWIDWNHCFLF